MPSIENKPVKRYSRSLGLKILLAIVLTIIILGLLATLTTYFTSRNVLVDVQTTDLINATITESQETAQVFTQSQNLVKSIASQANIVGFMSGQATEMDMEHVVKHSLLEDYNIGQAYSSIYLINSDGLTILSTDKTFEGKNYGFRDYFIKALAGEPYVDVSVGVTSNKLGYYFSHPITNSNNQVVGVAVVKLKPEIVSQTISNQTKEGIEVMLVDEYGVVIYSPEEDKVFHSLGPIPSTILKTITEKKRYGNIKIEALGYSAVQDRLNNYQEPSSVSIRDEYDGEDEVLSFSQVGSLPFYIVSEMKISQASQFATNTALTLAVFVLTAALMAAIIISILVSRFLKPLSKLQEITKAIIQGDLNQKVSIHTGDELEDFANTLNTMTEKLKESRASIEQKVVDRTQQLEKLNQSMTGRELKMIELKKEIKKLKNA